MSTLKEAMTPKDPLEPAMTFVCASNNEEVLRKNFLASPALSGTAHEVIIRRDSPTIGTAFNDAIDIAANDIIVFVHQDVILPEGWDRKLADGIMDLESAEIRWGVLGCWGINEAGKSEGYIYTNGLQKTLGTSGSPREVKVLDEVVLVIRKSRGLRFDPKLPGFHLYGTDICLLARKHGLRSFALSNYCIHNSLPIRQLRQDFWNCVYYIRKKWNEYLPVATNCVIIHKNPIVSGLHRLRKYYHYNKRWPNLSGIRRRENALSETQ